VSIPVAAQSKAWVYLRHGFTAARLLGLWFRIPSACLEVTCREYVRCPKLVKIYHDAGGCTKLTFLI
jgi:hypothetical protein